MNYRHAYHAGNFADVHKHVVLLALLEHLRKKPAPFFVLDTHAGRGRYDLGSPEAKRGGEWQEGIGRLREYRPTSTTLREFLELESAEPGIYRGSPLLIADRLRDHDRAVFVELQPEENAALKQAVGRRRRITVVADDGYTALRAHVPPKENRGLVLIDPPYESKSEFATLGRELLGSLTRWPNGIYCVWYPIKHGDDGSGHLERLLIRARIKKILTITLEVRPSDSPLGLNGSGLLIVNPPWKLDEEMRALLPQLHAALAPGGTGAVNVHWLAGE